MSLELSAPETVLLFGGPMAGKQHTDGSIRFNLRREDFHGAGAGDWVVFAELADMTVSVEPCVAADLARRVMARPAEDGLLVSESLILDRRAEVLAEAAETAGAGR